jgi:hypothetical protein
MIEKQTYRPALVGHDRHNGVILQIGDRFIQLGRGNDSLLLAQEIADRWNTAEPLEPLAAASRMAGHGK